MTYYVGFLDGRGKVWGVRIPDLPGCHGGGTTPEAATADAISATREWVTHQITAGAGAPVPRPMRAVLADPRSEFNAVAGEAVVMIPLLIDKGRSVRPTSRSTKGCSTRAPRWRRSPSSGEGAWGVGCAQGRWAPAPVSWRA